MHPGGTAERDDWNSHWDTYAASAEQNPAQLLRRELVFSLLALDGAKEARILDIGSGQGDFARELHARFPSAKILGVELSQSGVDIAKKKVPSGRFVQRDLLQPAAVDLQDRGWATHAVCSEVLEHVDDPARFLANVAVYLAPGCRLVVTVPGGPMSAFDKHIGHRKHFTVAALRQLLAGSGLSVERVEGAGFPFFNLYRLVVMLRGQRLIADAEGTPSRLARAVMEGFRVLFRFNSKSAPWGWQLVATAQKPQT